MNIHRIQAPNTPVGRFKTYGRSHPIRAFRAEVVKGPEDSPDLQGKTTRQHLTFRALGQDLLTTRTMEADSPDLDQQVWVLRSWARTFSQQQLRNPPSLRKRASHGTSRTSRRPWTLLRASAVSGISTGQDRTLEGATPPIHKGSPWDLRGVKTSLDPTTGPSCLRDQDRTLEGATPPIHKGSPWDLRGVKTSLDPTTGPSCLRDQDRTLEGATPPIHKGSPWDLRGVKTSLDPTTGLRCLRDLTAQNRTLEGVTPLIRQGSPPDLQTVKAAQERHTLPSTHKGILCTLTWRIPSLIGPLQERSYVSPERILPQSSFSSNAGSGWARDTLQSSGVFSLRSNQVIPDLSAFVPFSEASDALGNISRAMADQMDPLVLEPQPVTAPPAFDPTLHGSPLDPVEDYTMKDDGAPFGVYPAPEHVDRTVAWALGETQSETITHARELLRESMVVKVLSLDKSTSRADSTETLQGAMGHHHSHSGARPSQLGDSLPDAPPPEPVPSAPAPVSQADRPARRSGQPLASNQAKKARLDDTPVNPPEAGPSRPPTAKQRKGKGRAVPSSSHGRDQPPKQQDVPFGPPNRDQSAGSARVPLIPMNEEERANRIQNLAQEALKILDAGGARVAKPPQLQREEIFHQELSLGSEIQPLLKKFQGSTPFIDWEGRVTLVGADLETFDRILQERKAKLSYVSWFHGFVVLKTPEGFTFFLSLLDRGTVFWFLGLCLAQGDVDNLATGLLLDPPAALRSGLGRVLKSCFYQARGALGNTKIPADPTRLHQYIPYLATRFFFDILDGKLTDSCAGAVWKRITHLEAASVLRSCWSFQKSGLFTHPDISKMKEANPLEVFGAVMKAFKTSNVYDLYLTPDQRYDIPEKWRRLSERASADNDDSADILASIIKERDEGTLLLPTKDKPYLETAKGLKKHFCSATMFLHFGSRAWEFCTTGHMAWFAKVWATQQLERVEKDLEEMEAGLAATGEAANTGGKDKDDNKGGEVEEKDSGKDKEDNEGGQIKEKDAGKNKEGGEEEKEEMGDEASRLINTTMIDVGVLMALIGLFGQVDFPVEYMLGALARALWSLKSRWVHKGVNAFSALTEYSYEWCDTLRLYLKCMIGIANEAIEYRNEWDGYMSFLSSLSTPEPQVQPFLQPSGRTRSRVPSSEACRSRLASPSTELEGMGVDIRLIQQASVARRFPDDLSDARALVDAGLLSELPPITRKGKAPEDSDVEIRARKTQLSKSLEETGFGSLKSLLAGTSSQFENLGPRPELSPLDPGKATTAQLEHPGHYEPVLWLPSFWRSESEGPAGWRTTPRERERVEGICVRINRILLLRTPVRRKGKERVEELKTRARAWMRRSCLRCAFDSVEGKHVSSPFAPNIVEAPAKSIRYSSQSWPTRSPQDTASHGAYASASSQSSSSHLSTVTIQFISRPERSFGPDPTCPSAQVPAFGFGRLGTVTDERGRRFISSPSRKPGDRPQAETYAARLTPQRPSREVDDSTLVAWRRVLSLIDGPMARGSQDRPSHHVMDKPLWSSELEPRITLRCRPLRLLRRCVQCQGFVLSADLASRESGSLPREKPRGRNSGVSRLSTAFQIASRRSSVSTTQEPPVSRMNAFTQIRGRETEGTRTVPTTPQKSHLPQTRTGRPLTRAQPVMSPEDFGLAAPFPQGLAQIIVDERSDPSGSPPQVATAGYSEYLPDLSPLSPMGPPLEEPSTLDFDDEFLRCLRLTSFRPETETSDFDLLLAMVRIFGHGITSQQFKQIVRQCRRCHNVCFRERRHWHRCNGRVLLTQADGFDLAGSLLTLEEHAGLSPFDLSRLLTRCVAYVRHIYMWFPASLFKQYQNQSLPVSHRSSRKVSKLGYVVFYTIYETGASSVNKHAFEEPSSDFLVNTRIRNCHDPRGNSPVSIFPPPCPPKFNPDRKPCKPEYPPAAGVWRSAEEYSDWQDRCAELRSKWEKDVAEWKALYRTGSDWEHGDSDEDFNENEADGLDNPRWGPHPTYAVSNDRGLGPDDAQMPSEQLMNILPPLLQVLVAYSDAQIQPTISNVFDALEEAKQGALRLRDKANDP
ncbi:hypothetical protein FA13DRAFT_1715260 [Coprinellus micaceus]|uniref:Uncharacterized protein n=1 Tax=Coprinellus micaceus TaxID=71717 RepID=A0A4Y7SNU9_COPMI|nr:hypothetical protein FA13DRAFT_1715260 [Coprinellus micaceus]